ncbi:hypothetical protein [Massilia sp. 9I]|uniref:hypothetical protein n=1 Tax=Massilia sp. 9I TaxID=2653152 RepID=UPI0012F44132|nr:hypothetical protein [Massilia sp. 9I]VXB83743.1 conserved membrane hypothetical protein [Massilia sp. 9I]
MTATSPFFLMLRSRRAYFRRQSFALYLRYAHLLGVLLMLFGVALAERPALLAEPILHFWRAPGSVLADAAWAGTWLACIFVWVRIHRGFIAGGPLASFTRSLPLGVGTAPLVDAAMLLVGLQVFLVPVGLSVWTVATEPGGAGHWFGLRAALLVVLSLHAAHAAATRVAPRAVLIPALGFVALAGAGLGGMLEPAILCAALLAAGAGLAGRLAAAPALDADGRAASPSSLRLGGWGFLLAWQLSLLARRHAHAALPRLGLAIGIQAASLWMIFGVGKLAESSAFLKVGCWLSAATMSGFFYLFWTTRQPLQAWQRSLRYGALRMALAEQACVLGATALLFAGAYAACLLQPGQGGIVGAQLVKHAAGAIFTLALLGAPIIQRHQDGILIKIALLVVTFLLL